MNGLLSYIKHVVMTSKDHLLLAAWEDGNPRLLHTIDSIAVHLDSSCPRSYFLHSIFNVRVIDIIDQGIEENSIDSSTVSTVDSLRTTTSISAPRSCISS